VVILVGLELATRAWLTTTRPSEEARRDLYPAYDGGFAGLPVCHPREKLLICQPTPYLDLVPDQFPRDKPKREVRIFTIGASVSRGDSTSYSALLERELQPELRGRSVRVINFSARGIGSRRQRLLLEEALRHEPDLILLHPHGSNEYEDERDLAYARALHADLGGLTFHSRFVVTAKKLLERELEIAAPARVAEDDPARERELGEDPEVQARYHDTLTKNLLAMMSAARSRKVPVLVIGRADREPGSAREEALNDLFRKVAADGGEFFDLESALESVEQDERERLFRDRVHLRADGHRLVAARLAPRVVRLLQRAGRVARPSAPASGSAAGSASP
jgi:lysophospholipase L1-like esterase